MDSMTEQKYTVEDLKAYIGKTIMFEVEVCRSERGEDKQFPLLMITAVKECSNGNSVVIGVNLMRLNENRYNMAEEKHKPYRSFKIENIKYGSIKLVLE